MVEKYDICNTDVMTEEIKRLKQSQQELTIESFCGVGMFDNIPVGCIIFDTDTTILAANIAFEKILRYDRYELVGRKFSDMVYLPEKGATMEVFEAFKDEKSAERNPKIHGVYVNHYIRKDKSITPMYWLVPRADLVNHRKISYAMVVDSFELIHL